MSEVIDIPEGFKKTKIGIIPIDWDVKKAVHVGTFSSGTTPSRQRHTDYFLNGHIPWVKTTDLTNGDITITEEQITEQALDETSLKVNPKGTILIAMYGGFNQIGRTGLLRIDATINQALTAILPNGICDGKFLLEWFNHRVGYWKNFAGSSRKDPNITGKDVKDFPIAIPSLPEQQKIAAILSTWDKAIEHTQNIIEQLRLRNKGLAQQLLTGKTRLKGFNGEWKKLRADKIFKNHSDKSHNGDLEVLSATQERGVIPRRMNNIDIKFDAKSLGTYKKVEVGDYVISLRSFQGGIEYSFYEGLVSPAYTVLKEIPPISKTFYRIYFKTETFINLLNTIIYGIRDGKQISYKDFSTLKLSNPSIDEQQAIAKVLQKAEEELDLYKKKLTTLQEQKKGLMQELLTGKTRVNIPN